MLPFFPKISEKKKFLKFFDACPKQRQIDFLIFHHIEADNAKHAIELLEKNQVSSHYLIDRCGKIFCLVNDSDIAYHAGVSCWKGFDGLNKNSIGIEFQNPDAFNKKFSKAQLRAGLALTLDLMRKYNIPKENVIGHSDIAYFAEGCFDAHGIALSGFLDRKQDPSDLFDWNFFAKNGVGLYPNLPKNFRDKILFRTNMIDGRISEVKKRLSELGYKINNFDDHFDLEFQLVARVFNRHFNGKVYKKNPDFWWKSSDEILKMLQK